MLLDFLQIGNDFFDILVADILGGAANLVDDTTLQTALGIYRLDSLHHTTQTVGTEQINIQNAPTFEVIQHIQPKFAAFMLTDPNPKNVFLSAVQQYNR